MYNEKRIEIFNSTINYLPENLRKILLSLPTKIKSCVSEIRLRAGRPLSLTLSGENIFISKLGEICYLMQQGLYIVNESEIENSFHNMCNHSVYAYKEQIKAGYIPLNYGCRAGIAATAVYENGLISNFRSISSINIRLANEYIDCARPFLKIFDGGLLIAGPPSCGKTTLLRDSIRLLSYGIGTKRKRVAVIDTRGEITAVYNSIPQNDIGPLTDVITSCEKAEGIEIAIRTLNPEIIAFDEITSLEDVKAVSVGFFGGVDILTTVHVGSVLEIYKREAAAKILEIGAIKNIAFIKHVGAEPEIYHVANNVNSFKLVSERQGVCVD